MATGRITKIRVEALAPGDTLWDADARGFGVRCQRRDATYILKARIGGVQRFLTIGKHGAPWTPETARQEARRLLGEIAAGRDPALARDERRATPTLAEFADRYLREHAERHKKPRSVEEDRRNLKLHVLPALGRFPVTDITGAMIARFHGDRSTRPTNANRCLALLSHMFTVAAKWGLVPKAANPCSGIDKYAETKRERFLSREELARLGAALVTAKNGYPEEANGRPLPFKRASPEDPRALALVWLLLFTGARLTEVLTLRWAWIDWERGVARLPTSKTGAKNLNLPPEAVEVLRELPRMAGNPFVLWGDKPGQHFNGPQKAWQRIRALADLGDVRLHDLRHSFASAAVRNGENLFVIGNVLGHKQHQTTQRYTHLDMDPGQAMTARTAAALKSAMTGPAGNAGQPGS